EQRVLGRRHHQIGDRFGDQETEQVAEEHDEYAEMEQIRAPAELAAAKELRRVALPRVLITVEADQAADEEHRECDVWVDAEQESMQGAHRSILVNGGRPTSVAAE